MKRKVLLFDEDDFLVSEIAFGKDDNAAAHLEYLKQLGAKLFSEKDNTSLWALPDDTVAMLVYIA